MKRRPNKLDPFAAKLREWGAEGKTLAQIQELLKGEGCAAAVSAISDYLARQRREQAEAELFSQIASGARQCREVEESFGKNPAPALETIIKIHRVVALQLATAGASNPELLELAGRATKMVLEFAKLEAKRMDQVLDERRVKLLEEAAERARKTEEVLESGVSGEEQAARIREIFKR